MSQPREIDPRRSAHPFRAHPLARQIESDEDLVGTCRYLARNPLEAGLPPRISLAENALQAAFGGDSWRRNYINQIRR